MRPEDPTPTRAARARARQARTRGPAAWAFLLLTVASPWPAAALPRASSPASAAPLSETPLSATPPAASAAKPLTAAERLQGLRARLARNRDHLESTSRRLTLPQALAMALERNPILAKAHDGIEATRWSGVAIRREWMPSLKAGNSNPGLVGVQQKRDDTLSVSSPELTLEWTFFDPGRRPRARANAASLEADRFLFDVEARSLVLSVQESYIDLQALLTLEREYVELSAMVDHWLLLARARGQGRAGPESPDVDQLLSQQLAQLILRIDTHEQVIAAASKLAQALSLPPGDLVLPAEPLALRGQWTLSRQESIAQGLRLREEIQRSLALARGLRWTAVATRSGYWPTLSVEGTGSTQTNSDSSDLSSEATVGMNVRWTLFDGGILAAKASAQQQLGRQALRQAQLDQLAVTAEVETAYAAYVNSQIVVDTASAQKESARASFQTATRSFQAGSSDATTLLQVLANTRGAVEAWSRAVRKHNRSVAALERTSARWPEAAQPLLRNRVDQLEATRGVDPAVGDAAVMGDDPRRHSSGGPSPQISAPAPVPGPAPEPAPGLP
ncbi:MAG: TolC family protein [Cyanobacteriota bacterium]|nr:TolC family protein [Cyanobacteriota bacterium]